jgi:hypothetical protein
MCSLLGGNRLFQQHLDLRPDVLILILEEILGPGVLSADDAVSIDEKHFRNISGLAGRPLRIFLNFLARREPHWKIHTVISNEVRNQGCRVGIVCRGENLQALRSVFLLNAAQNLSGVLAVRSSSVHEGKHHYLPRVLAQQHLAAIDHADRELAGGAWNLLGRSNQSE